MGEVFFRKLIKPKITKSKRRRDILDFSIMANERIKDRFGV